MVLQSLKTLNGNDSMRNVALEQFRTAVLAGMQAVPKMLDSKYFYDKTGDALFQKIMVMPEYYLTDCEMDIFKNRAYDLSEIITEKGAPFDLIELGAGDATKSSFLLRYLLSQKTDFTYMPIDISANILSFLYDKLSKDLPELNITGFEGEYLEMLSTAVASSARRKIVLFLGSNIGNMEKEQAFAFCRSLRNHLSPGDIVIMGFDLKKNPKTILDAYNDKAGITAAFNLNLLSRINRELDADFDKDKFEHYQTYDPIIGACRSYLICSENLTVNIGKELIHFTKDEPVFMELSQKYSLAECECMAKDSGFASLKYIMDSKSWFTDAVWLAV
ncbi:L-histidine N(alpha)-methyltransferase [Flavobacterium sp. 3-210]